MTSWYQLFFCSNDDTERLALLGEQRLGHQRLEHVHDRVDTSFGSLTI